MVYANWPGQIFPVPLVLKRDALRYAPNIFTSTERGYYVCVVYQNWTKFTSRVQHDLSLLFVIYSTKVFARK